MSTSLAPLPENSLAASPILDENLFTTAQNELGGKINTLIQFYIEDANQYVTQIQQGLAADQPNLVYPAAHSLKSSSRQLGCIAMAVAAQQLELTAREAALGTTLLSSLQPVALQLPSLLEATTQALKSAPISQ